MESSLNRVISLLRRRGIIPSQQLVSELQLSRATLSRVIAKAPQSVVRLGKTKNTQYGLLKELPSLGSKLPIFRINEIGNINPLGNLCLLHQNYYYDQKSERAFEGLPPEIADMTPQGFMGRIFGRTHAEALGISSNPADWSNDQILIALARRGEDLASNLVVGLESAERWSNQDEVTTQIKDYPRLARAALQGQPAGSSAGGEQPKFTAQVQGTPRRIKFVVMDSSPFSIRWRDLLLCEFFALDVLNKNKIETARCAVHEFESMLFLDSERFDRIGPRGRRSIITLAGLDDFYFGVRDHWTGAAERLERSLKLTPAEARKLRLIDAFGALIADSDRHFYNIVFFSDFNTDNPLEPKNLRLAPSFDKLPMFFAPVAGQVLAREWKLPLPHPDWMDVWDDAVRMASDFWKTVANDIRISKEFRKLARVCAAKVA